MKYKTILFDADMTLFDFKASESHCLEQTLIEYAFPHDPQVLALYSRINDSYWKRFERGEIDRAALLTARFDEFFHELNVSGNSAEFNRRYLENMGESALLLNGAEELCRDLCQTHRLYIITNGNSRNQRRRFEKSGFHAYFKDFFISEEIGYNKPSKEYFDACFAAIDGFDREKAMIVGDSLTSDIRGGINAGLKTVWVNPDHLDCGDIRPDHEIEALHQLEALLVILSLHCRPDEYHLLILEGLEFP
mgnify:CR=1 FL=1